MGKEHVFIREIVELGLDYATSVIPPNDEDLKGYIMIILETEFPGHICEAIADQIVRIIRLRLKDRFVDPKKHYERILDYLEMSEYQGSNGHSKEEPIT